MVVTLQQPVLQGPVSNQISPQSLTQQLYYSFYEEVVPKLYTGYLQKGFINTIFRDAFMPYLVGIYYQKEWFKRSSFQKFIRDNGVNEIQNAPYYWIIQKNVNKCSQFFQDVSGNNTCNAQRQE